MPLPMCMPPTCMPVPTLPPVIISEPADAALLASRSCDADMGSMPALMLLMLLPLLLPDEWKPPIECGREAAGGNDAAAEEPTDDEPGMPGRVANEGGAAAVAPAGPSGGRAGEPVLLIIFQRAGSATQRRQCRAEPKGRQTNTQNEKEETFVREIDSRPSGFFKNFKRGVLHHQLSVDARRRLVSWC
jgi:hypothetical protein